MPKYVCSTFTSPAYYCWADDADQARAGMVAWLALQDINHRPLIYVRESAFQFVHSFDEPDFRVKQDG